MTSPDSPAPSPLSSSSSLPPLPTPSPTRSLPIGEDPVRRRRAMVAKWNSVAKKVGYLAFLVAIATFFVALSTKFTQGKATIITTSIVIGSVLLAPAIVLGYAVKAAERDDRSRGL